MNEFSLIRTTRKKYKKQKEMDYKGSEIEGSTFLYVTASLFRYDIVGTLKKEITNGRWKKTVCEH